MIKDHYRIRFGSFILQMMLWSAWMTGWCRVPAEELVWAPIKWIMIVIFSPIGLILLGALTGYRVDFNQARVRTGFFPFIRTVRVEDIAGIREGAVYPYSIWRTTEFVTLVPKKGKPYSFPCNDAGRIVKSISPFIKSTG